MRPRDAIGRLAAAPVRATRPVPERAVSAMDGFALGAPTRPARGPYRVRGAAFPSREYRGRPLRRGEATYITTGAPVPRGTTAVARIESVHRDGDRLYLTHRPARDQDIVPAGEGVERGELLVQRGQPIGAGHVGALYAQRRSRVAVVRLRVTILPVGDELGSPDAPTARRWDFLGPTVAALLPFAEVTLAAPLPDERRAVTAALCRAERRSDLIVTIGGSSVGRRDVTKAAVRAVGRLWFDGVRANVLKRGAVGRVGRVPVVVLPGQIVSAVTVFHEHGLHLVSRMVGRELRQFERATLARDLAVGHRLDSTYLFAVAGGTATPLPWGVARLGALLRAQAFAVVRRGTMHRAGTPITVQRLWTLR